MTTVKNVGVELIHPNPHRNLADYPWNEDKIAVLMKSIKDVGLWEGMIARPTPKGKGYQLAFGHHRLEAAKRVGMSYVPLIIRDLSDEEMLKFMGRENGEDYRSDFLVMLNTWQGAVDHLGPDATRLDVATVLGWTYQQQKRGKKPYPAPNVTAETCAVAYELVRDGHMRRSTLSGLGVTQARQIVRQVAARFRSTDAMAKATKRPTKDVKKAKKAIIKGAEMAADAAKQGKVATRDLRATVDAEAYRVAGAMKVKPVPLFATFGTTLSNSVERMLDRDASAKKLQAVVDSLHLIAFQEDVNTVRKLIMELDDLAARAKEWKSKLQPGLTTSKPVFSTDEFPALPGRVN